MSMDTEAVTSAQPNRVFKKIVVKYLPPDLCAYKYKGKPYFSIQYTENGEEHIGYGTYNPNILTEYLIKYFMPSDQDEPSFEAIKEYCNKRCLSIVDSAVLREYAFAHPKQRWAPCNERLPNDTGLYLVTINSLGYPLIAIDGFLKAIQKWEKYDDKVIAWMPMPKPYKGAEMRGEQNGQ